MKASILTRFTKISDNLNASTFDEASTSDAECKHKYAVKTPDFDLDKFVSEFEGKILSSIKLDKNLDVSVIKSAADVENINQAFKLNKISGVYSSGISLNTAVNYLSKKGQIQFEKTGSEKTAFIIDDLSTQYMSRLKEEDNAKYQKFIEDVKSCRVILYCFASGEKEAEGLINRFDIDGVDLSNVKIIKSSSAEFTGPYPDKNKIKNIIKIFAEYKFPGDIEGRKKLISALVKYLSDCFLYISYSELRKMVKAQYSLIKKEVLECGKTMDDVIYVYTSEDKSYAIVNYLYAMENGISQDKFMKFSEIEEKISVGSDKTYVILDDVAISGGSLIDDLNRFGRYLFGTEKGENVIMAPLVYTPKSKDKFELEISHVFKSEDLKKSIKFLGNKMYAPIGKVEELKGLEKAWKDTPSVDVGKYKKDIEKYMKNFKSLSESEIDYLSSVLKGGCGNQYGCVFFPYMIPDNSSDFATIFADFFLNHKTKTANKGIDGGDMTVLEERISQEDYNKIIENINSQEL